MLYIVMKSPHIFNSNVSMTVIFAILCVPLILPLLPPVDLRQWTCVLEHRYYHPTLLDYIKILRRIKASYDFLPPPIPFYLPVSEDIYIHITG